MTTLGLLFSLISYAQTPTDTVKVLAKLIEPGQGSKIYIAKYEVFKLLQGDITSDTLMVGYYFYTEPENIPEIAVLTLKRYSGMPDVSDYYHFYGYNAEKGMQAARIDKVDFDYWEGCETGKGECNPLNFTRPKGSTVWFLKVPCGGSETYATLGSEPGIPLPASITGKQMDPNTSPSGKPIQAFNGNFDDCKPYFNLTHLEDGTYYAYMLSCSLGGQIEIRLQTID